MAKGKGMKRKYKSKKVKQAKRMEALSLLVLNWLQRYKRLRRYSQKANTVRFLLNILTTWRK